MKISLLVSRPNDSHHQQRHYSESNQEHHEPASMRQLIRGVNRSTQGWHDKDERERKG